MTSSNQIVQMQINLEPKRVLRFPDPTVMVLLRTVTYSFSTGVHKYLLMAASRAVFLLAHASPGSVPESITRIYIPFLSTRAVTHSFSDSVSVRECEDCVVIVACQQYRVRDCKNLTSLLYV